ncbi:MAG: hypothetical protein IT161_14380 [Bryobacterales bacterium]|nr:hypothetical protein [Bryobacterales bacterium]
MTEPNELLDAVVGHLCEHQPEEVAGLTDGEIRRRAAIGIERARQFGFEQPATVVAYVSLLFVAGPHFDEQPAIRKALIEPSVPPDVRIAKLFEQTRESDWDEAATLPLAWD